MLIVCDVTNKTSFDSLNKRMYDIERYATDNTHLIIIGNKIEQLMNMH